ncbi:tyrosine-type recombinase/integrase [Sulfitobacter faviae]|uniref:Tyrosine-type recombinase/integrase n=1 Tax=Sulfitobacter faviae TaxID=1775881 RepID=A0ABZ0UV12_9RHOB|nr:tyrosine-type recombinase/integrase [Sulfitobacter faviae]WPZ20468.1 tyrosine-type recombinase/integrase [Sulfitobacter faviae]
MSSKPLSTMDHKSKAEDMQYLIQPRGSGKSFVFRMVTPTELIGTPNPWTGKPFGKEIRRGLGTRRLSEARHLRDIYLGEVRKLALGDAGKETFELKDAQEWRDMLANDDGSREMVLNDKVHAAAERGVPETKLRSFMRVALGKGYPISKAVDQYIDERSPGNRRGFKPISKPTQNDLRSSIKHLRVFLNDNGDIACLEDVTPTRAKRFRDEFLPNQTSPRSPHGLSHKTINKNVTLLKGMWDWAVERGITNGKYRSPWVFANSVPRAARSDAPSREDFKPDEVSRLFAATTSGTREGDLLRIALVTGCRVDEIASMRKAQVEADGSGFIIMEGKTANARRYMPVPEGARALLKARLDQHPADERVFPEWPLRASTGKVYAASQWFTRFRREVLGEETDGRLALHSFRHTWRTVARQARIPESDVDEIGGWSKPKNSSSVYDHGLQRGQLQESQELVWEQMQSLGYLSEY